MPSRTLLETNPVNTSTYLSELYFEDVNYITKLATSAEELDAALKLRFEVFNLELGEGLQLSYKTLRDEDAYDKQCDHLIIVCKLTNKIIGTYRMQSYEKAQQGYGFYSNNEYHLDFFPSGLKENAVELGRACIAKEYRNTRILFMLWSGIAKYTMIQGKRYLFGCCSLKSQNSLEGHALWNQLKRGNYIANTPILPARDNYSLADIDASDITYEIKIPPLLGMYLRYGAKVVSTPAIDHEFKTIDYLVLVDTVRLSPSIRKMFFNRI
jgi:putative hemolysin